MGLTSSRPANKDEKKHLATLQKMMNEDIQVRGPGPTLERLWTALHAKQFWNNNNIPKFELISNEWMKFGFRGANPVPDFKGAGQLGVWNLIWFLEKKTSIAVPMMMGRMRSDEDMEKAEDGNDESYENYPWALAGIKLTLMLAEIAGIGGITPQQRERYRSARTHFWPLLSNVDNFHEIYGLAFQFLETEWRNQVTVFMQFQMAMVTTEMNLRVYLKKGPKSVQKLAEYMDMTCEAEGDVIDDSFIL